RLNAGMNPLPGNHPRAKAARLTRQIRPTSSGTTGRHHHVREVIRSQLSAKARQASNPAVRTGGNTRDARDTSKPASTRYAANPCEVKRWKSWGASCTGYMKGIHTTRLPP